MSDQTRGRVRAIPRGTRDRVRRARSRALGSVRHRGGAGVRALRNALPPGVRRPLARRLLWHRDLVDVPTHRILVGGQNGMSAAEITEATGLVTFASTRVADGPHADLLRRGGHGPLSDEEILSSAYGTFARAIVAGCGQYFSATGDAGIVEVAREQLARAGVAPATDRASARQTRSPGGPPRPHQSREGEPVLLAPIRGSQLFQVVDGHHRVAAADVAGERSLPARIRRTTVTTPLQDMLDEMSWIGGLRELYQPVDAPELDGWSTVRGCTDRLGAMRELLATEGVEPPATYLDVASCYGWFVASMAEAGYDARGVERDPLGPALGETIYGLPASRVHVGDAVEHLRGAPVSDVVSCFSLLHHFALGRASVGAEELVRLLDRVTGRVLFLDTGQAHEEWFETSLAEWDTAYIADFLSEHGSFDRVLDLGPDHDAVAPFERNYGRHLFACIKDR